MKIALCASALLAFTGCMALAERPQDRIDEVLGMTTVDQCNIKANLYVQGIRAYYLRVSVAKHIEAKQSGVLTAREKGWMSFYMVQGWKKAMVVWGNNTNGVSREWALKAGAAFNRACMHSTENKAIEV